MQFIHVIKNLPEESFRLQIEDLAEDVRIKSAFAVSLES